MKPRTKLAIAGWAFLGVIVGGFCGAFWGVNAYWERSRANHNMDCDSMPTPAAGCILTGVPTITQKID